jgi:hypothetical protein
MKNTIKVKEMLKSTEIFYPTNDPTDELQVMILYNQMKPDLRYEFYSAPYRKQYWVNTFEKDSREMINSISLNKAPEIAHLVNTGYYPAKRKRAAIN